jgi:hypothetical protein
MRWPTLTTAPQGDVAARTLRITHPFHPWHDRQFELVAYKSAWGENRVYFYNEEQQLTTVPARWTDVVATDPFVAVSAGRAVFRSEDLLELSALVRRLLSQGGGNV